MSQYRDVKKKYPDGILFFQVGDFYETFYDDAVEVSGLLNIALTTRDKKNPVPLAGVPIHAAQNYISRLLNAGRKVVICDQVEKPGDSKGIVRRIVTDVITPGTTISPGTVEERENNYIISALNDGGIFGIALLDLSTGEFSACECGEDGLEGILAGMPVREAIVPEGSAGTEKEISRIIAGCRTEEVPAWHFDIGEAAGILHSHFGVMDLSCFDLEDEGQAIRASGALLRHVKDLRKSELAHITGIRRIAGSDSLYMDAETMRNLELFEPLRKGTGDTTLIGVMDRTMTPAGGRLMRRWLMKPSRSLDLIKGRLDGIESFVSSKAALARVREKLRGFPDIERIVSRISAGKALPRELLSLSEALSACPGLAELCVRGAPAVDEAVSQLEAETSSLSLIAGSIDPDCPSHMRDGGFIRRGFDDELDELIDDAEGGKRWIASLQQSERGRTGIPSLRVGYNKVFGYYIEVSRAHLDKVPDDYSAKQTLVNSQRYVTGELKERESRIMTADSRRIELEREIFARICSEIAGESGLLQRIAEAVSKIDVMTSLADLATEKDYCRPSMSPAGDLVISEGRHPVVEEISESDFIPNDLVMRPEERQLLIITGPNMGGKSTFIRQAALISIMGHMGSYVPASRAEIGIMDRVFTRVGSSDNLARGQSTFLVEMAETARILHGCTSSSLVLLDEVGRGTSTLDGLSLAWAVTEYLVENEDRRPKTLFATHYHELTSLADRYSRIHNLMVRIREWGDGIVFLYRIEDGRSDRSYGIHVARLAGLPRRVVDRASAILEILEKGTPDTAVENIDEARQLDLFPGRDRLRERLSEVDPDRTTPVRAVEILAELRDILKEERR